MGIIGFRPCNFLLRLGLTFWSVLRVEGWGSGFSRSWVLHVFRFRVFRCRVQGAHG